MEVAIELRSPGEAFALYGSRDQNLRLLREQFQINVVARNDILKLMGSEGEVAAAESAVNRLLDRIRGGEELSAADVERAILDRGAGRNGGLREPPPGSGRLSIALPAEARGPAGYARERETRPRPPERSDGAPRPPDDLSRFSPRTPGQARYLEAIRTHDIVLGIGPSGTGKTFLAVLAAVEALRAGKVHRLCLVRPAVEAGERLGFLPGDFYAKVNPYLRPLYDALHEILDFDTVRKYLEREVIEIAPLAYMRGRTLNRSFIILDEGQNTTRSQMKMFLTRMGEGSRIVATGDVTQVDIPDGTPSGLVHAQRILAGVPGVHVHLMTPEDIVRHPLVWRIVEAYDKDRRPGPDEGESRARS